MKEIEDKKIEVIECDSTIKFIKMLGFEVRCVGVANSDEYYYCANDVLRALGYKQGNWRTTLKRKCDSVIKCNALKYRGQAQNFIDEGDVYTLIIGSKLPEAIKFQDWVFDEVLPSIRKNGFYIMPGRELEFVSKMFPSFSESVLVKIAKELLEKQKNGKYIEVGNRVREIQDKRLLDKALQLDNKRVK